MHLRRTDMNREQLETKYDTKGSKAAERHSLDVNSQITPNLTLAQQFLNQPFFTSMPCHRLRGAGTRGEDGALHPPR